MEQLKVKIIEVLRIAEVAITEDQVQILDRGVPHIPKSLPPGKFGIYTFSFENKFLKIGKAGSSSNARFLSQHYRPSSSNSNLAKSILMDAEFERYSLSEENINVWIKQNVRRIDILVDASLGIFVLNLIEAFLHVYYQPKFEGFAKQRI